MRKAKPHRVAKGSAIAPPDFLAPQLATLVNRPPDGQGWVHEIKFDGYRLFARVADGHVRLMTRNRNDWTKKFQGLADRIARIKVANALLDGEVVHVAVDGTMSFHGLQNALSEGDVKNLRYFAFDLLFFDGVDLRQQPLVERKASLQALLKNAPNVLQYSDHFSESGADVLRHACAMRMEGIISKRAQAPYQAGRGNIWLKSKCLKEQELVVGGYTEQPKHPGTLGALLMGYYEKGGLVFAGKVGTGFTDRERRAFLAKLKALARKDPPFVAVPPGARRGAVYVRPALVANVRFTEWTPDGLMRHPSFQGLREDKLPEDVIREREKMPRKPTRS